MCQYLEPACRICLKENLINHIHLLEYKKQKESEAIFGSKTFNFSIYPCHICGQCKEVVFKFSQLKKMLSLHEEFVIEHQEEIIKHGIKMVWKQHNKHFLLEEPIITEHDNSVKIEESVVDANETFDEKDESDFFIYSDEIDDIDVKPEISDNVVGYKESINGNIINTVSDKETNAVDTNGIIAADINEISDVDINEISAVNINDATEEVENKPFEKDDNKLTKNLKKKERRRRHEAGTCEQCNQDFRDISSHMKNFHHIGMEKLQCPKCPKMMLGKQRLRIHLQNTHSTETVSCPICGPQRKLKKSNLPHHLKEFHKEKEFACDFPDCKVMFKKKRDMKKHCRKIHLGEKELCSECGIPFKDLTYHMRTVHSNMTFSCDICKKVFATQESLTLHSKSIHNDQRKKEVCDICAKEVFEVDKHIKYKHSGLVLKSLPCVDPKCDKMFRTKQEVTKHNDAVHLNKKSTCPLCDGIFKNVSAHISQNHTGKKKHVCNQCGKAFVKKYDLNVHVERVHIGRRYICPDCGKVISKIKEHLKVVHNKTDVNMDSIKQVNNGVMSINTSDD